MREILALQVGHQIEVRVMTMSLWDAAR